MKLILLVAAVIAAVFFIRSFSASRRDRLLRSARAGIDAKSRFFASFPDWPLDRLDHLYRNLQRLKGGTDFPVLPEDRLYEDLRINHAELTRMVGEIVETFGGSGKLAVEKMPGASVQTVRDVVNWIDKAIHPKDINDGPN